MRKTKLMAIAAFVICAGYMFLFAEFVQAGEEPLALVSIILGAMSAYAIFRMGMQYEEQIEMFWEEIEMEEEQGEEVVTCKRCGCGEFEIVAGRLVCTVCGEVLERED